MKTVWKKFWPLLTVGIVCLAVLAGFGIRQLRSTPQKAVEGYLRASLEYDADGLLRHASAYQIKELSANAEVDLETLRKNLKQSYELASEFRETGKITFSSEILSQPADGSEAYEAFLETYAQKADADKVSGFAVVSAKCYVDGKYKKTYTAVAVKCGARWYYAFVQ